MNKTWFSQKNINFSLFLTALAIIAQQSLVFVLSDKINNIEASMVINSFFYAIFFSVIFLQLLKENILSDNGLAKMMRQGLVFIALGNIIALFDNNFNLSIFSRIVAGAGTGILVFSQWQRMKLTSFKENLKFLVGLSFSATLVALIGPSFFIFISHASIDPTKVSFIFVFVISLWSFFNLSSFSERFFAKAYQYINNIYNLFAFVIEPIQRNKKKLGHAGLAYSFDMGVNFLINFPLYAYIIWKFGLIKGFVIMIIISFVVCWIYLIIYDLIKKDLFLLEEVKGYMEKIGNYNGKWKILRLCALAIRKGGKITAFFYLSLWRDPFYTVAFCRTGKYNGLSFNDWMIFIASLIVGNVSLALVVFGGISGVEKIIK